MFRQCDGLTRNYILKINLYPRVCDLTPITFSDFQYQIKKSDLGNNITTWYHSDGVNCNYGSPTNNMEILPAI